MKQVALIFGYNDYGSQIAKNIIQKYKEVIIFKLDDDELRSDMQEHIIESFDLSDEWSSIEKKYDLNECVAFCVLEDDAENIFLTISLRSQFKDLMIIALSSDKESANKLSMAGANKVIPVVQTTAQMISDILDKPVVTEVLHSLLYEQSNLKVAEIKLEDASYFKGEFPTQVKWELDYNIMLLSVIHTNGNNEFLYSSKERHHPLEDGDSLVVVGYEADIELFKKRIGVVK